MKNVQFQFGKMPINTTAADFCQKFALVIDQNADKEDQVSVRLIQTLGRYKPSEEFVLDETEQASVFGALNINVLIPKKKAGGGGNIRIMGNVDSSNLIMGDSNSFNHTCTDGNSLTTIISGNGVIVSNR